MNYAGRERHLDVLTRSTAWASAHPAHGGYATRRDVRRDPAVAGRAGARPLTVDLQEHGRTADVDRPLSRTMVTTSPPIRHLRLPLTSWSLVGRRDGRGPLSAPEPGPAAWRRLIVRHDAGSRRAWRGWQHGSGVAEAMKQSPMTTPGSRRGRRTGPVLSDTQCRRGGPRLVAEVAKMTAPATRLTGGRLGVGADIAEFYACSVRAARCEPAIAWPRPRHGWPSARPHARPHLAPPTCLTWSSRSWMLPPTARPLARPGRSHGGSGPQRGVRTGRGGACPRRPAVNPLFGPND